MLKDILALFGAGFIICCAFCIIYSVYQALDEFINRIRYNYRIKHRFDKPPTASCYCRDCRYYDVETDRCYRFDGVYVADNCFCWRADPVSVKEERKEEKYGN